MAARAHWRPAGPEPPARASKQMHGASVPCARRITQPGAGRAPWRRAARLPVGARTRNWRAKAPAPEECRRAGAQFGRPSDERRRKWAHKAAPNWRITSTLHLAWSRAHKVARAPGRRGSWAAPIFWRAHKLLSGRTSGGRPRRRPAGRPPAPAPAPAQPPASSLPLASPSRLAPPGRRLARPNCRHARIKSGLFSATRPNCARQRRQDYARARMINFLAGNSS